VSFPWHFWVSLKQNVLMCRHFLFRIFLSKPASFLRNHVLNPKPRNSHVFSMIQRNSLSVCVATSSSVHSLLSISFFNVSISKLQLLKERWLYYLCCEVVLNSKVFVLSLFAKHSIERPVVYKTSFLWWFLFFPVEPFVLV
jgi:hypothetical protein